MEEYKEKGEELSYEPEWCESCYEELEADGIEYTFDYYVEDGVAYCAHCGRSL